MGQLHIRHTTTTQCHDGRTLLCRRPPVCDNAHVTGSTTHPRGVLQCWFEPWICHISHHGPYVYHDGPDDSSLIHINKEIITLKGFRQLPRRLWTTLPWKLEAAAWLTYVWLCDNTIWASMFSTCFVAIKRFFEVVKNFNINIVIHVVVFIINVW